jgi:hypothetical protein
MTAAAEFPNEHDPAHQAAQRHTMQTQEGLQYLATLAGAKHPEALARKLIMLLHGVISYRQTMADTESIEVAKALAQPLLDAELPAPPPKEKAKFRAMRAKC